MITPVRPFPLFPGWMPSTPSLPSFYWDVKSNEQRWKHICFELQRIADYLALMGTDLNLDHKIIKELQESFEKFQESGFFDYYADQLEDWINDNMQWIFQTFCKMLWFGLTDDGYFVAYVPDAWEDVTFDTGANYNSDEYGRLILEFYVNDEGSDQ